MRFAGGYQRGGPLGHFLALAGANFVVEIVRKLLDLARQHRQVDDADRGELVLALDGGKRIGKAVDPLFETAVCRQCWWIRDIDHPVCLHRRASRRRCRAPPRH
ncbi:hypothetical protein D3C87_1789850 [compost metagenome]